VRGGPPSPGAVAGDASPSSCGDARAVVGRGGRAGAAARGVRDRARARRGARRAEAARQPCRGVVAGEPVDFRCGIDGLARVCDAVLATDPFSGTVFVFRNRRGTAIKLLTYDTQGFWLAHKRLSQGRFRWWPTSATATTTTIEAHQLQRLVMAGNPAAPDVAPVWRAGRGGEGAGRAWARPPEV